ncbi:hypothetical protein ACOSQ4_024311 [Xanthoceras sorbifolium]
MALLVSVMVGNGRLGSFSVQMIHILYMLLMFSINVQNSVYKQLEILHNSLVSLCYQLEMLIHSIFSLNCISIYVNFNIQAAQRELFTLQFQVLRQVPNLMPTKNKTKQ